MKRVKKIIGILLIVACGSSVYFYLNYVRIAPELLKAYEQRDIDLLKSFFEDDGNNWYQKTRSIELYSRIKCSVEDPLLLTILESHLHQNRLSVFEGCFSEDTRDFLISRGLKDRYSYARYTTLKYLEKRKIQDQFQGQLKSMILKDSSSMVKNQAKLLLNGR